MTIANEVREIKDEFQAYKELVQELVDRYNEMRTECISMRKYLKGKGQMDDYLAFHKRNRI